MSARTIFLLGVLAVSSAGAALSAEPKVGDVWTFESRDGYNSASKVIATYRVEVTDISHDGISTRVTNLTDGSAGDERFTRGWAPLSAEGVAIQAFAFSPGYLGFSDYLPPSVGWQPLRKRERNSRPSAMQSYEFVPAYPEFPDRLEPGVSWQGKTSARDATTGLQIGVKVLGKVIGKERIRVPAGEFDTVKLERFTYVDDANFWHSPTLVISSEWYAPSLGRSVKYETRSQYYEIGAKDRTTDLGDWTVYELASYKTK